MTDERLDLGRCGEDAAEKFLRRQGLKILERNMRTPVGEIDIVAADRTFLVFVEVKTRSSQEYGNPAEAVSQRKQRQIIRAANWYLNEQAHKELQPRFDVVAVIVDGKAFCVEHIPDAFGL